MCAGPLNLQKNPYRNHHFGEGKIYSKADFSFIVASLANSIEPPEIKTACGIWI